MMVVHFSSFFYELLENIEPLLGYSVSPEQFRLSGCTPWQYKTSTQRFLSRSFPFNLRTPTQKLVDDVWEGPWMMGREGRGEGGGLGGIVPREMVFALSPTSTWRGKPIRNVHTWAVPFYLGTKQKVPPKPLPSPPPSSSTFQHPPPPVHRGNWSAPLIFQLLSRPKISFWGGNFSSQKSYNHRTSGKQRVVTNRRSLAVWCYDTMSTHP